MPREKGLLSAPQKTDRSLGHERKVSRSLCVLVKWPPAGAAHLHASAGDTKAYARSHPTRARARPQFCTLGRQFAQLAPKLRIRKQETGCSADLALPASGDFWNAQRRGPARARRAGRDPAGSDTRTRAAPPQRGRQSYLQRARARVCAPTALRSLPAPRSGMRSARDERAGPLRRERRSSPAPPAAPPQREVCACSPAALCALLLVGVAAEGGCDGTGRRGRRAAPPPGSPRGRLRAQGRKEALREGPERGAMPGCPAARSLSAQVPPPPPAGAGAPGSWRARSPLLFWAPPGSPGPLRLTPAVPQSGGGLESRGWPASAQRGS